MQQWLIIIAVVVALAVAWRFAVRPWLEGRAGPADERAHRNHTASAEARERRARHKDHPDIPF